MRRPTTVLWVATALVAFELAMRCLPQHWFEEPTSARRRLLALRELVLEHYPAPRIVVLGSSRSAHGVMPQVVDETLGLPPRSTVNASYPGLGLWECVQAYRDNRARLGQARLVIVSMDEFFLFRTNGPEAANEHFTDAIRKHRSWDRRVQFILDALFSFRARLPWALYHLRVAVGATRAFRLNWRVDPAWGTLVPDGWADQVYPMKQADVDAIVDSYYLDTTITPQGAENLRILAAMVREDGGRLVIMQMPNHPRHQERVEQKFGEPYRQHAAAMEDASRSVGAASLRWRWPSEIGLTGEDYRDTVHLRPTGARKFSRELARLLREKRYLEPGP